MYRTSPSLKESSNIGLKRSSQISVDAVGDGVRESDELRRGLHDRQHPAFVASRLYQSVEQARRPKYDIQHWVRVQKQHLLDLSLHITCSMLHRAGRLNGFCCCLHDRGAHWRIRDAVLA